MYFWKTLFRGIFTHALYYPGRSFHEHLLEKIEYAFIFASIEEIRKEVSFATTVDEQDKVVCHYGRVVLLLDDLLETSGEKRRGNLRLFMEGKKKIYANGDGRIAGLGESLSILRPYIDRLSREYKNKFWKYVRLCYQAETENSRRLQRRSEQKGGAFILSLVYLLQPAALSERMSQTLYYGGAWAQMIDDYFDNGEDNGRSIQTIFSNGVNREKLLDEVSMYYARKIEKLYGGKDFLIPFGNDMVKWVKRIRMLSPILHPSI